MNLAMPLKNYSNVGSGHIGFLLQEGGELFKTKTKCRAAKKMNSHVRIQFLNKIISKMN